MSGKFLFDHGCLFYQNMKFGLTDLNVGNIATVAEVGDPETKNDLLVGRQSWSFTATIFARVDYWLVPSTAPEAIVLVFGSKAYYGDGVVERVSEVGRLSDAVVLQVTGRFQNASYQLELVPTNSLEIINTYNWPDDNDDGVPNGFTKIGTGADLWEVKNDEKYGRYLYSTWSSGGTNGILHLLVNFANSADHRIYMPYTVNGNIGGFHQLKTYASRTFTLSSAFGSHTLNQGFTAVSGDDLIEFENWGDLGSGYSIHYKLLLIGQIVNSI